MVAQIPAPAQIEYPDSDGRPMSDNTKQFRLLASETDRKQQFAANLRELGIDPDTV